MLSAIVSILTAVLPVVAASKPPSEQGQVMHRQIHAEQLKSWYDQEKSMIVLDARSKKYFDGTLLPHAKWLPSESTEQEIKAAIPSKNDLIVVYCLGVECPASGWLYEKLISLGYKNVYEYHEGLEDWVQRGYPTEKQRI
jgi:rhodanese-related sulfurtransferase